MKKQKINALFILLLAFIFSTISVTPVVAVKKTPVKKIEINTTNKTITLKKGKTLKLKIKQKAIKVTWKSSKPKVVKVSSTGKIKALKKGKATITVTAKDGSKIKDSVKVTVGTPVSKITITNANAIKNLNVGKTFKLTTSITPTNASTKKLAFTSSKKKIATVSSKGVIKGIAPGTAYIYAKATDNSKVKAKYKVKVVLRVKSFTLNNSADSKFVQLGTDLTLKPIFTPDNATIKTLNWSSSNTKIATVNSSGKVTTHKVGTTTIKAITTDGSNKTKSYTLQVISLRKRDSLFIAHRGYSAMAPENSIAAYKLACQNGFGGVECDIRRTKDGVFVLSHDASLDRIYGVKTTISESFFSTLENYIMIGGNYFNIYNNEHLPTLDSYLTLIKSYPNTHAIIDIKADYSKAHLKDLFDQVSSYHINDRVEFITTHPTNLTELKEIFEQEYGSDLSQYPQLALLVNSPEEKVSGTGVPCSDWCIKNNFNISCNYTQMDRDFVDKMHDHDLSVGTFTISDFNTAYNAIKTLGVDSLTSNYKFFE